MYLIDQKSFFFLDVNKKEKLHHHMTSLVKGDYFQKFPVHRVTTI